MKRKEIVLVKETRQNEFLKKVMNAISPYLELKASDKIAIKINLSGSREIYANTHYETVESMIFYLKEKFGISDISVIEGSDGAYYTGKTTWDIFYKFRYKEVELNGAKLVNLDELPHDNQIEVETLSGTRQISYCKYEADYIINIVPPKTHNVLPVCLGIPNISGYVKPEERSLLLGACNSDLKKLNSMKNERVFEMLEKAGTNFARLLKEVPPSLSLIDGLYGMEGKGPIKGSPVFHGFAVASEDSVLADSLTTYIMGFDVDQVPYISAAYREGLGNNRWQNVIGVEPAQVKFPYRPHPFYQKLRGKERGPRKGPRNNRNSRVNRSGDNRSGDNRDRRDSRDNMDNRSGENRPGDNRNRDNRDRRDSRDNRENRPGDNHDRSRNNRSNNSSNGKFSNERPKDQLRREDNEKIKS